MINEEWSLPETQPALLKTDDGFSCTIWLKHFNIKKNYSSGVYDNIGDDIVRYEGTSLSGSFYIKESSLEDIGDRQFNLVVHAFKNHTLYINHCRWCRVISTNWDNKDSREVEFVAQTAEVSQDQDPLLLDINVPEEIQFLDRPNPLLKKRTPQRLKGRVAKVLAAAKRKKDEIR